MADLDDAMLEQVEEDIHKCEEFLRHDSFRSQASGGFTGMGASSSGTPFNQDPSTPVRQLRGSLPGLTVDSPEFNRGHSQGSSPTELHPELQKLGKDRVEVTERMIRDRQQGDLAESIDALKGLADSTSERRARVKKLLMERRRRLGLGEMPEGRPQERDSVIDFLSPRSSVSNQTSNSPCAQSIHGPPSTLSGPVNDGGPPEHSIEDISPQHSVRFDEPKEFQSGPFEIDAFHPATKDREPMEAEHRPGSRIAKIGVLAGRQNHGGPQEVDPSIWSTISSTDGRREGADSGSIEHSMDDESQTVAVAVKVAVNALHSERRRRSSSVPRGSSVRNWMENDYDSGMDRGRSVQRSGRGRSHSQPRERPGTASKGGFQLSFMSKRPTRHSKEAVQRRLEAEQSMDLTFRPKFVARQKSNPRSYPATRDERINQLAQPKTHLWKKCERERSQKGMSDMRECSFKPRTGRGPQHKYECMDLPVQDRLFHAYDDRKVVRARLKMQQELSELGECTFKPVTNTHRVKPGEYRPIQHRVTELQQKKKERIMSHKAAHPDMTFAPAINQRSLRIAVLKEMRDMKENLSFVDRLTKSCEEGPVMNRSKNAAKHNADKDCTFNPAINPLSKKMIEHTEVPDDFLERQRYFDEKKREQETARQIELEDQECTFSPYTGSADDVLAASRLAGRLAETVEDRVERLAFKDAESRDCNRDALAKQHYSECTFHPEINPNSKKLGKSKTVEDLYHESRSKKSVDRAKQAAEVRFSQECTFKPATGRRPGRPRSVSAVRGSYSAGPPMDLLTRAQQHQSRKDQKLDHLRKQREKMEFKECTFTPDVIKDSPKQDAPVLVQGLGRHIELQQLAARLKEDQNQREAKAFLTNPTAPATQFTVPEPFHLTEARDKAKMDLKRKKLKETLLSQAMRECTFQPKTNAAVTKELLQQILDADSASAGSTVHPLAIDDR
ncbi:hypothetical protein BSKO_12227 [Bryopsis sp. KO-2023]|nr:hypothetical protein BSKO_12227 [Bryopsis sp. KO-2023]